MTRRDLLTLGAVWGADTLLSRGYAQAAPDITLRIQEITAELGPRKTVKTLAYNGQTPGPLLRMTEGRTVNIEVINETAEPDLVHWHGFHIPPDVDGAQEEGSPMLMGMSRRRYSFTARPSGTRWYHSHNFAGQNLGKGTYSGQFGMVVVESRQNPARYDREVPIIFHEWGGYFSPDKGGDVDYTLYTINGKMLGAGEPVRVRPSERVLFRVLNASATMHHRLALPGHTFMVVALDGNPVPTTRQVPVLELGPGERVDAVVLMNTPGVWVLGEEDNQKRNAGAGIVVEYAGKSGPPRWATPPPFAWQYAIFGADGPMREPVLSLPLVFEPQHNGHLYSINGKLFPDTGMIQPRAGERNRLIFDNRSSQAHPVHLHRHTFEITRFAGKPASGVLKDVVVVPPRSTVEVDFTADSPGLSLFHCHQQFHMDFGFMALMAY